MNLHQVLTGAVNPGDHCFSVGSVGDQRFTVSPGGSAAARRGSASLSPRVSAWKDGQSRERASAPAPGGGGSADPLGGPAPVPGAPGREREGGKDLLVLGSLLCGACAREDVL